MPPPEPAAQPELGSRIDRYELRGVLGRGAMGVVYRARDLRLGRDVALKLVRPSAFGHARSEEQLAREAQAMARLSHPNVVAVFDVGTSGDFLYTAMELVEGTTLRQWMAERRPWREAVVMLERAGRGLAAAHDAGLVHRDFKPDNVLIGPGAQPRVTDFGLAKLLAPDTEATEDRTDSAPPAVRPETTTASGGADTTAPGAAAGAAGTAIVGTPAYMAPEQRQGRRFDVRADQFAFCVTFWEALYGARPPRIAAPAQRVPRWLRAVVERGLRDDPAARWPSMHALLDALARGLRRRRRLGYAAAVVGAAAVAAALLATPRMRTAPSLAEPVTRAALVAGAPTSVLRARRDEEVAAILLDDGKTLAYVQRGKLWRRERQDVDEREIAVALPAGAVPLMVRPSGRSGWLILGTRTGDSCSLWHVGLGGQPPLLLAVDPTCLADAVDLAPDGATIARVVGNRLFISDARSGDPRAIVDGGQWEPTCPTWSRDGRFLAVALKRPNDGLWVIDAVTGRTLHEEPNGRCGHWLEGNRLAFAHQRGQEAAEVRILASADGGRQWSSTEVLSVPDARIEAVTGSADGLLVQSTDLRRRVFLLPIDRDAAPIRLADATAIQTGASNDYLTAGWLGDDGLVVLSRIGRDRALIRVTPSGEREVVDRIGPLTAAWVAAFDGGIMYFTPPDCRLHRFMRRGGRDRSDSIAYPCRSGRSMACASRGPCALWRDDEGTVRWFDVDTLTEGAPLAFPMPAPAPAAWLELTDDGRWLVEETEVGLRWSDLRTGLRKTVALDPPATLLTPRGFDLAHDGSAIAVKAHGHGAALIEIQPDGTWRERVIADDVLLSGPTLSPDRRHVGFLSLERPSLWTYVPLEAGAAAPAQGRTTILP